MDSGAAEVETANPSTAVFADHSLALAGLADLGIQRLPGSPPQLLEADPTATFWLAGRALWNGRAQVALPGNGYAADPVDSALLGTLAGIIDQTHFRGVISSDRDRMDLWFAAPLDQLRVFITSIRGVVRRRPGTIKIASREWQLEVRDINAIDVTRQRRQPYREADFEATLVRGGDALRARAQRRS